MYLPLTMLCPCADQESIKNDQFRGHTRLDRVLAAYNILPLDAASFRAWAILMHRRSDTLMQDAMIAASATIHRLTVVTRNVRDFDRLGMHTLNPFAEREQRGADE